MTGVGSAAQLEALEREDTVRRLRDRRSYVARRALLAADVAGLTFAFMWATQLFPAPSGPDHIGPSGERLVFLVTLPAWAVIAHLHGLYDSDGETANHSTADDLLKIFQMVTVGSFMVIFAGWLSGAFHPTAPKLFSFWMLAIVAVPTLRALSRILIRRLPSYVQRTLIVGAGDVGQRVAQKIAQHPEYGLELIGFVDDEPKERGPGVERLPVLGGMEELTEVVRRHSADRVVIAFSKDDHETMLATLRALADRDVLIDVVPRYFEAMGPGVRMHTVEGLPLATLPRLKLSRSSLALKRGVDLLLSVIAVLVMLPLGAAIAIAIKLDSEGPVFFRQTRMGAGGETFRIFKFRTMDADAEAKKQDLVGRNKHASAGGDPRMFKVLGDPRITTMGQFLRRWSLDELPQLLNVIRGEMSLVGPRPLILEENRHVVDWRKRRLHVKPGITGLWQVLGRDDIPFEEMTVLDYSYVTTWSLLGDLQLMLRTLPALTRGRGTS